MLHFVPYLELDVDIVVKIETGIDTFEAWPGYVAYWHNHYGSHHSFDMASVEVAHTVVAAAAVAAAVAVAVAVADVVVAVAVVAVDLAVHVDLHVKEDIHEE